MRAVDLIRIKRDGGTLDREALHAFVSGVTDGSWPDYRRRALLMAVVLRGHDRKKESAGLTDAMVRSQACQSVSRTTPPFPSKKHQRRRRRRTTRQISWRRWHSESRGPRPMMSGRGLGHTGGTPDKLESIPGFVMACRWTSGRAVQDDRVRADWTDVGDRAGGSRSTRFATSPARWRAFRSSPPQSLSKKIAEGIGGLVLDVKSGHGAFVKTPEDARRSLLPLRLNR